MVAHLVRLRLQLLRNSLRRSPAQLVGVLLGAAYGLVMLGIVVSALFSLRSANLSDLRVVLVLGGSVLVLAWAILPVVAAGMDMSLDPRRFATFAVPPRELLTGLALAGLLGVPGLVTALIAALVAVAWAGFPLAAGVALLCAGPAVALCVVSSRLVSTVLTLFAASRRLREIGRLFLLLPVLLLGPLMAGLLLVADWSAGFADTLAVVAGWTPAGFFWAAPADVADGRYGSAALRMILGAATIAVLVWGWKSAVERTLVTASHERLSGKSASGVGLFRHFPARPAGAVAARALTYWTRDPRYAAGIVIVPLLPVILWSIGTLFSDGSAALMALAPITAFLLAWSIATDVSYDGTAFWLHAASGVDGRADRLGRAGALLLFAIPTVIFFGLGAVLFAGRLHDAPAMIGVSLGILLSGTGLASVMSALFIHAAPRAGDSPFARQPGSGFLIFAGQFAGWTALSILLLPQSIVALIYLATGNPAVGWATLGAGVVLGLLNLGLGVLLGGWLYNQRVPEILRSVVTHG